MSDIEVSVTLSDGNQASYTLDRSTTLSQFREMLKEDDFMAPEEMFKISDHNSLIPKSQEKTKTLEALKVGDILRITIFNKAHAHHEGDNSPTKQMAPLVKSIESASNELLATIVKPAGAGGNVDVMDLGQNEMENLLNNCAYLYGRTVTSNKKVKLGSKRFFGDVPQNHRFEKSNRGTTGSGFLEKIKLTATNEEHELYSQGYTDAELEADIHFIAKVHGKASAKHSDEKKTHSETKYVYAEISFSKASFALSEMRSVISDDVKTFFKHGEKITLDRLNQFFDTFGAIIPDRITVGGKFFSSHEVTINTNDDHASKKLEGEIGGSMRFKVFKGGVNVHGGKEEEAKQHSYHKVDEHVLQCYGGDASCKDKPDQWIKSLNNNYKTWQIVSVDRWSWSYDYLDEEFRHQIKELLWLCNATKVTYSSGDVYEGEILNNERHGKGKLAYANGDVYFGGWKHNKRDGKGEMKWKDGKYYSGDWKDDHLTGKAICKFPSGVIYEGEIQAGEKEGKGKMTYASGDVYFGDWKHNKRDGKGEIKWKDGDFYSGDWKDDLMTGKGTFKNANGNIYEGEFKEGKLDGKGKMTYATTEAVYIGDWKDGAMEGKAEITWKDGNYYSGDWKNGHRTGKGIFKYANGTIYEGDFIEEKRDGVGKETFASGIVFEGHFKDGERHGKGKITKPDGSVSEGDFKNGKSDGKMKSTYPNGIISYEGDVKANKREGFGKKIYENGDIYEGEWKENLKHGKGKMTYANGNVLEGDWLNDEHVPK